MVDNGTRGPIRFERRQQERIKMLRGAPSADFISQLIVERNQTQVQAESAVAAVDAYAATGRSAVRRMPAGYRKTVVA